MSEPAFRYIVIRSHPDLPKHFLPSDLEGKWFDATTLQIGDFDFGYPSAVAVAVDRFERRDDGATARVYEVRP